MDVASAVVLLTTDPESGGSRLNPMNSEAVIGGAFLLDLVARHRVELSGTGRKARVVVSDPTRDAVSRLGHRGMQGGRVRRAVRPRLARASGGQSRRAVSGPSPSAVLHRPS